MLEAVELEAALKEAQGSECSSEGLAALRDELRQGACAAKVNNCHIVLYTWVESQGAGPPYPPPMLRVSCQGLHVCGSVSPPPAPRMVWVAHFAANLT